MKEPRLSREEQARREVGVTTITRRTATLLVTLFAATILAVPIVQQAVEITAARSAEHVSTFWSAFSFFERLPAAGNVWREASGSLWARVNAVNRHLLHEIQHYETTLEDESFFSQLVLPRTQQLLAAAGAGNEKAYIGRDGWLFYRPDVEYLTAAGFLPTDRDSARRKADPVSAIIAFHEQLAARNISLVVVPTPSKAAIHPEQFSRHASTSTRGVQNRSFTRWRRALEAAGVHVFDPTPVLTNAAAADGSPQFLATDSHWLPEAMQAVARQLAEWLHTHELLPPSETLRYHSAPHVVSNGGDIAAMLRLPEGDTRFARETVTVEQVIDRDGQCWRRDPASDVLLLGDSFSNIYSLPAMNWGEAAGFAEHLSLHLQRPLDCILRNDDGAFATRAALARELAQGNDRLAGKRLVIWQFAARELTHGDWKMIELASPAAPIRQEFIVPDNGELWEVTGEVIEVSPVPRPGSVPYKDHIVAMHLRDVRKAGTSAPAGEAVVYLWSMRDNIWTPAAHWSAGDRVHVRLRAWSDVAAELERFNRSELADVELQLHDPCWGELLE